MDITPGIEIVYLSFDQKWINKICLLRRGRQRIALGLLTLREALVPGLLTLHKTAKTRILISRT